MAERLIAIQNAGRDQSALNLRFQFFLFPSHPVDCSKNDESEDKSDQAGEQGRIFHLFSPLSF